MIVTAAALPNLDHILTDKTAATLVKITHYKTCIILCNDDYRWWILRVLQRDDTDKMTGDNNMQ